MAPGRKKSNPLIYIPSRSILCTGKYIKIYIQLFQNCMVWLIDNIDIPGQFFWSRDSLHVYKFRSMQM